MSFRLIIRGIFLLWFICSGFSEEKSQIIDQGDKVQINLKNADIGVVIKYLAKFSGHHYLVDPTVKGKINIIANKPVTRSEAVIILEEALIFHNFTIMQHGLAKYVVPTRFAKQYGIEVKMGKEGVYQVDTANLQMRFFKLDYIGVRKMNTILNTIMGKNGQIIPHVQERMLQIIDTTFSLRRMAELMEKMDVPDSLLELFVVHLENTKASKMAAQIKSIFAKNLILKNSPNAIEAEEDKINFIADDRTNKILVITHPKYIEQIRETTRILDQELGAINQLGVYRVQHSDPESLKKLLTELFPKDEVKLIPDERMNAILVISRSDRMIQTVLRRAEKLDLKGPEDAGDVRVYYLEHSDAKDMADILSKLFDKKKPKNKNKEAVSIVPDEATNALVITGSRAQFDEVVAILKKLDIFRSQVLVEAVIVEVNMKFAKSLGLNAAMLAGNVGSLGSSSNGVLGIGGISDPTMTPGQGFNVGIFEDNINLTNGLPTPWALLKILKTSSHANLLSAPQILTLDNEEANINVGELVPIQTTTSTSINQSSNIRFEDVGLDLTIKPRITRKKTISLDVKLEVKSRSRDSIEGVNVPIIGRRGLKTVINTKHGDTVVIGGLMRDEKIKTDNRVPVLSRIPWIGRLFQKKETINNKTNLFVFLTPYILTDQNELKQVTKDLNKRMKASMDDSEVAPLSYSSTHGVNSVKEKTKLKPRQTRVDKITVDGKSEPIKAPLKTKGKVNKSKTSLLQSIRERRARSKRKTRKIEKSPFVKPKSKLKDIPKKSKTAFERQKPKLPSGLAAVDRPLRSQREKPLSRAVQFKPAANPQTLASARKKPRAMARRPKPLARLQKGAKSTHNAPGLQQSFENVLTRLREEISKEKPASPLDSDAEFKLLVSQLQENLRKKE